MPGRPHPVKLKSIVSLAVHSACALCAGAFLLSTTSTRAQNLFVSNYANGGPLYQYTPDGTQSTFNSGLPYYEAMAFNSAGNLFVGAQNTGAIYKITPAGVRTTFTPESGPSALLFAFEAVVIGGMGSLWGTFMGAVILGVAQTVGAKIAIGIGILAGHLVFLAVLFFKPTGLFARTL